MSHTPPASLCAAADEPDRPSRRGLLQSATAMSALLLPGNSAVAAGADTQRALSRRWSRALQAGDYDGVAACYSPDFVIWNNVRRTAITGAQHLASLRVALFANYSDRAYVDVRFHTISGGFVQQHRLTALHDGVRIDMPICIVCQTRGDRFTRVDEYLTLPAPELPA